MIIIEDLTVIVKGMNYAMLIIEDLTVIVKGMNYGHYWRPDCDCEGYELWSLLKTWLWLWRVWTMVIIEDLTEN